VSRRSFKQVDVFAHQAFKGNPVAVVLDAGAVSEVQMAAIARWTNLSETTFVLPAADPKADYRVRIFSTLHELPFAGHPTLGTCHAWLEAGGKPKGREIIQECGVGLVRIRQEEGRLAFVAPPLLRSGPVKAEQLLSIRRALGIDASEVLDAQWVDNGTGWLALRVSSPDIVLRVRPNFAELGDVPVGIFAEWPSIQGAGVAAFEVRAFIAGDAMPEDPVTGSLAAGVAQWLRGDHLAPDNYVIHQGRMLGREGKIHVTRDGRDIWVGGNTVTLIDGTLDIADT